MNRLILTLTLTISLLSAATAGTTKFWNHNDESNPASIDHQPWQTILDKYLITNDPSGVNRFGYGQITKQDQLALKTYLAQLQKINPRAYRREEQMAYWINLYNALTVDLIINNYPVKSIKKTGKGFFSFGPWDDDIAIIAGQTLSLNDIEHKILRPLWKDPRIHYAVNCASYGCPNLSAQAYTASNTNLLLEQGAKNYINHPRGVSLVNDKLKVSSIYHWYSEDFGGSDQQLILHLQQYANPKLKQQLQSYLGSIDHDYDWRLNEPAKNSTRSSGSGQ